MPTMASSTLLPPVLGVDPVGITIVLFSQPDCAFCEEVRERYLKPLIASPLRHVTVAEALTTGTRRIVNGPADVASETDLARRQQIAFAPTVAFLGARGETLAPPIVGLSRDYFGAYLESRIAAALRAAARRGP